MITVIAYCMRVPIAVTLVASTTFTLITGTLKSSGQQFRSACKSLFIERLIIAGFHSFVETRRCTHNVIDSMIASNLSRRISYSHSCRHIQCSTAYYYEGSKMSSEWKNSGRTSFFVHSVVVSCRNSGDTCM